MLSAIEAFSTIAPSEVWTDTGVAVLSVPSTASGPPISVTVTTVSDFAISVTVMPQLLSHKGVEGCYEEVVAKYPKYEQAMVTMDGLNEVLCLVKTATQRAKEIDFHES